MFPAHGIDDEHGGRKNGARILCKQTDIHHDRRRQRVAKKFQPEQRADEHQCRVNSWINCSVQKGADLLKERKVGRLQKFLSERCHTMLR